MKSMLLHSAIVRRAMPTLLFVLASVATALGEGRTFILGISPSLTSEELSSARAATVTFVATQMRQGDRLAVYDAGSMQPVAELAIPDEPLFAGVNPRLNRLAKPIATLKAFFQRKGDAGPAAGAVMAPQFLELAARQLRTRADEPLTVIFLGNPFYHDREEAFDFGPDGTYPGDGFLFLPGSESPFSTIGKKLGLANVTVHWAYLKEDRWLSDAHRLGVLRFWSVFVGSQSGTLASAAADPKGVFERAAKGAATPIIDAAADPAAKAEMILIRRTRAEAPSAAPAVTAGFVQPVAVPAAPPAWLSQDTVPQSKTPPRSHGRAKVGLRWGDGDPSANQLDLDLYVIARPGVKELSYRRTRTPEGRLWKDWVTSPNVANGYETVELEGETDVTQLGVCVNFYGGYHPSGPVKAVLRFWIDGDVREVPIEIRATNGNRGAELGSRARDPHWVVVDVAAALGLR